MTFKRGRGTSLVEVLVYIAIFAMLSTIVLLLIRDAFNISTLSTGSSVLSLRTNLLKERINTALDSTAEFLDRDDANILWNIIRLKAIGTPLPIRFPLIFSQGDISNIPEANWGNAIAVIRLREFHEEEIGNRNYSVKIYEFLVIYPTRVEGRAVPNRIALGFIISPPFVSGNDLQQLYPRLSSATYRTLVSQLSSHGIKAVLEYYPGTLTPFRIYEVKTYPWTKKSLSLGDFLAKSQGDLIKEFKVSMGFRLTDFSVAFNTVNPPVNGYQLGVNVPAFMQPQGSWFPSGFEVCIYGPKSARVLFYRLTLVARSVRGHQRNKFYVTWGDVEKVITETY